MLRINIALGITASILYVISAWMSVQNFSLNQEFAALETEEREILEDNKQLLTAISLLRSPKRILQKIEERGDLQLADINQSIYLRRGAE